MKKILLGFGLGLFLFAAVGCDKETVESASIDSREAIQFNAYLGKQVTRAEANTLDKLKDLVAPGFPVWVFDQDGDLIQPVSTLTGQTLNLYWNSSLGKWTYDGPILYYPIWNVETGETVTDPNFTFISVYPEQAVSTGSSNWGFHFEADGQIDLIGAHNNTHATQVSLAFEHLLSRINFAVAAPENVTVTISDIRLEDVYSQGNYSFTSIPVWTPQVNQVQSYDYSPLSFTVKSTTSGEPVYLRTHNGNQANQSTTDNSLYLLPQTFDKMVPGYNEDAYIEFKFQLYSNHWENVNGEKMELTIGQIPVKAYLKDFNANEWKEGSSYTYLIDFSRYLADGQIAFNNVSVGSWTEDEPEEFTGTMTFEILQLSQTALSEMIIKTIADYFEEYPLVKSDDFLQTLIQVDQPLAEPVTLNVNDLNELYTTIYNESFDGVSNPPYPYSMVICMKNGVAEALKDNYFNTLIKLNEDSYWDISYYYGTVNGDSPLEMIADPTSATPSDRVTGTPFYVIITPKTVEP